MVRGRGRGCGRNNKAAIRAEARSLLKGAGRWGGGAEGGESSRDTLVIRGKEASQCRI
jgi:hypothetical protein